MGVPRIYRTGGEAIINSISFTDSVTQLGYISFYALQSTDGTSTKYLIHPYTLSTDPYSIEQVAVGSNEVNFDSSSFQIAQLVKGKVYYDFLVNVVSGSGTQTAVFKARLLKVDSAGTEKEIAAQVSSQAISGASTTRRLLLTGNITNQELIQVGDSLRVEFIIQVTSEGGGTHHSRVYTDPDNSDGAISLDQSFKINIPFRLTD